ncbi:MAG: hypothetical protein AAF125_24560, partial [Chloroflexota bacterium]
LPSYDGKIFSEYIAYVGVSGLFLALLGALRGSAQDKGDQNDSVGTLHATSLQANALRPLAHRRAWIALVIVALLLAVGAYNPLNWLLVRLPGFDLFRVPARWLALYALGTAMLAGMGVAALTTHAVVARATDRSPLHRFGWIGIPIIVLIVLFGASFLASRVPEEVNGPARPTLTTLAAWGVAFVVTVALVWLTDAQKRVPSDAESNDRESVGKLSVTSLQVAVVAVVLVELVAASLVMPYNDLVPPDVWNAQRFTISQMLAYTETDENGLTADGEPPGRLLSISGLFFDPGDQNALSARYAELGMTPLEERYSFVAAKLKETLSPNLPLAWGVPTVDGFGGGLLPTRHYVEFMEMVYPEGVEVAVDGRLRENLALEDCRGACIPPGDALSMMDVEYLLMDKVYDVWRDGVAFDTALPSYSYSSTVLKWPPET